MNKSEAINFIYYQVKPLIPRKLQLFIRRKIVLHKRKKCHDIWPIDPKTSDLPKDWPGWPEGKRFALVLTHDVDTQKGHDKCHELMDVEEELGFRSIFNFVPERYPVSPELRKELIKREFEVGVHGLNHDGKLFRSRKIFNERANKINHYLQAWNAVGFRSPAMHHNLEWIHDLNIEYDMSTFDVDPFEPQADGVETIFPFWVQGNSSQRSYVELPYTLAQDFTVFVLMKEKTTDVWQKKMDWIVKKGGMALLNTHPDYMKFNGERLGIEEYPVEYYRRFLEYVKSKFQYQHWHGLPCEIAAYVSKHTLKVKLPYISEKRR